MAASRVGIDYQLKPFRHVWEQGLAYASGPPGAARRRCSTSSRARHPHRGTVALWRQGRHASAHGATQHRASVPVSRHLQHDDGRGEPRIPVEEPPAGQARHRGGLRRNRRDARSDGRPRSPRARSHSRRQAEDLSRARPSSGRTFPQCCSTNR